MYYFEKFTGYRSSGINFLYWMGMLGYGSIKIRSLSLIAVDNNGVRLHICYTLTCTHAHTLTWSRRFQYLHKHKMCTYYDMRVLILYVFMCVCVSQEVEDKFRMATFVVTFACILVQFLLSFVPDPKPRRVRYQPGPGPEVRMCVSQPGTGRGVGRMKVRRSV